MRTTGKIFAPSTSGKPAFLLEYNASRRLFIGSATKAFILASWPADACGWRRRLQAACLERRAATDVARLLEVCRPGAQVACPPAAIGKLRLGPSPHLEDTRQLPAGRLRSRGLTASNR